MERTGSLGEREQGLKRSGQARHWPGQKNKRDGDGGQRWGQGNGESRRSFNYQSKGGQSGGIGSRISAGNRDSIGVAAELKIRGEAEAGVRVGSGGESIALAGAVKEDNNFGIGFALTGKSGLRLGGGELESGRDSGGVLRRKTDTVLSNLSN